MYIRIYFLVLSLSPHFGDKLSLRDLVAGEGQTKAASPHGKTMGELKEVLSMLPANKQRRRSTEGRKGQKSAGKRKIMGFQLLCIREMERSGANVTGSKQDRGGSSEMEMR